jgi:hypothetical protein
LLAKYWDWAAKHLVEAWNLSWRPSISRTLYKALLGKKPDASKLRIFGSLVFYYIPKEKAFATKILPRSALGILVKYKGSRYKIWDPTRKELVTTNHIEIKESRKGTELLNPDHLGKLR